MKDGSFSQNSQSCSVMVDIMEVADACAINHLLATRVKNVLVTNLVSTATDVSWNKVEHSNWFRIVINFVIFGFNSVHLCARWMRGNDERWHVHSGHLCGKFRRSELRPRGAKLLRGHQHSMPPFGPLRDPCGWWCPSFTCALRVSVRLLRWWCGFVRRNRSVSVNRVLFWSDRNKTTCAALFFQPVVRRPAEVAATTRRSAQKSARVERTALAEEGEFECFAEAKWLLKSILGFFVLRIQLVWRR